MTLARLLFGAAAAALVACAADSDLGVDEGAHTAEQPVAGNDPMNWAEIDLDTFVVEEERLGSSVSVANHLDLSHAVTLRLQAWADRIDRGVRELFHERTGHDLVAPRPQILVIQNKEPNGWVSPVGVCFSKPFRVAASEITPPCVKPRNWTAPDEARIANVNRALAGTQCSLRDDGTAIVVSGAECATLTYDQLLPYAAAQYVAITISDVAGHASELGAVATLAHELGHYYRGHASSAATFQSFFYEQPEVARPERPRAPDDNARLLQESDTFGLSKFYASIPGQRFPRGLVYSIGDLGLRLGNLEQTFPDGFACHDAAAIAGEPWAAGEVWDTQSAVFQAGYLRLESALLECAPRIRVGLVAAANTVAEEDLLTLFGRYAVHGATTLRDFLDGAVAHANTDEAMEREFTGELTRRRLGLYTTEQEADEFQEEWTTRIGLDPKAILDETVVDIRNWVSKAPRDDAEITWDQCEELYRRSFVETAPDGARTTHFVQLGDLHDPHHGECYRVFNLLRELQAHRYQAANERPPVEGPWDPIKAQAKELLDALDAAPPPVDPPNVPAPNPDTGDAAADAAEGVAAPTPNGHVRPLRRLGGRGVPIMDRH
jgi:hypothetical protein